MHLQENNFKVGDKVTYSDGHGKFENGIIKSKSDDFNWFVVYHCDGHWEDIDQYTAARTPYRYLTHGWYYPEEIQEEFKVDISHVL